MSSNDVAKMHSLEEKKILGGILSAEEEEFLQNVKKRQEEFLKGIKKTRDQRRQSLKTSVLIGTMTEQAIRDFLRAKLEEFKQRVEQELLKKYGYDYGLLGEANQAISLINSQKSLADIGDFDYLEEKLEDAKYEVRRAQNLRSKLLKKLKYLEESKELERAKNYHEIRAKIGELNKLLEGEIYNIVKLVEEKWEELEKSLQEIVEKKRNFFESLQRQLENLKKIIEQELVKKYGYDYGLLAKVYSQNTQIEIAKSKVANGELDCSINIASLEDDFEAALKTAEETEKRRIELLKELEELKKKAGKITTTDFLLSYDSIKIELSSQKVFHQKNRYIEEKFKEFKERIEEAIKEDLKRLQENKKTFEKTSSVYNAEILVPYESLKKIKSAFESLPKKYTEMLREQFGILIQEVDAVENFIISSGFMEAKRVEELRCYDRNIENKVLIFERTVEIFIKQHGKLLNSLLSQKDNFSRMLTLAAETANQEKLIEETLLNNNDNTQILAKYKELIVGMITKILSSFKKVKEISSDLQERAAEILFTEAYSEEGQKMFDKMKSSKELEKYNTSALFTLFSLRSAIINLPEDKIPITDWPEIGRKVMSIIERFQENGMDENLMAEINAYIAELNSKYSFQR